MTHVSRFHRLLLLLGCMAALTTACSKAPGPEPVTTAPAVSAVVVQDQAAPYAVGSTTVFIHDESRPFDAVAGVTTGVRTLITEIWYPVAHNDVSDTLARATYGDYVFGDRDVHHRMMTQTTFFHLTPDSTREGVTQQQIDQAIDELFTRERGSYTDAPLASRPNPWPVIVMTHGDAGSRYNMQTVCEYLASHGYIVIAPDHTGNSPYAMTGRDPALSADSGDEEFRAKMANVLPLLDEAGVYGDPATYGQSYTPLAGGFEPAGFAKLDRAMVQRVNDLRAALDKLEQLNTQGDFAGKIDLSRIGLMGRSFGGVTTLAGLKLEDRFTAGFAVVAPTLPDLRSVLPESERVSPPTESVLLATDDGSGLTILRKPTLLLVGSEDHLILGLSAQIANSMGVTAPSLESPYPRVKSAFDNATVPAVYSVVQDTNHGSFGVAGPYWWPHLKPDSFPRFFDPENHYQLLPADTAHQIQKEMALAYFNLMLLQDPSGLETLRSNPWSDYGTSVQLRGYGQ
jgi:dienelactone hydrolase